MSCIMYQGDGRSPSLCIINREVVCLFVCLSRYICRLLCRIKLLDEKSCPKSVNAKNWPQFSSWHRMFFQIQEMNQSRSRGLLLEISWKKSELFNFINIQKSSSTYRITSQNSLDTEKTLKIYMNESLKNVENSQIYSSTCCPAPWQKSERLDKIIIGNWNILQLVHITAMVWRR